MITNFDLFLSFLEIMLWLHIILGATISHDPLLQKAYQSEALSCFTSWLKYIQSFDLCLDFCLVSLYFVQRIYIYLKKSKSRLLKQMSMANANTVCVTYTLIQSHFKHVQSTFMMFRSSSELHCTSICRISMWYIGYIESIITPIFPCG